MGNRKKFMLKPTGLRILKIMHLLFAMMWTGCGIAILLVFFVSNPKTPDELYLMALALKIIDDFGIIPGAFGCFVTGVLYGLCTPWGFFKQRWITIKWIIFTLLVIAGIVALGPWINTNAFLMSTDREAAVHAIELHENMFKMAVFTPMQLLFLILMTVISVFKPWKGLKKQAIRYAGPPMSMEDNR